MRYSKFSLNILLITVCPIFAAAQNPPTQNPPNQTQQQQNPGGLPPATNQSPNTTNNTIRPANESQQSTQPQTGVQQERDANNQNNSPRPVSPRVETDGQGNPVNNSQQNAAPNSNQNVLPNTQNNANPVIGGAPNPNANSDLPSEVPPVAPNFEAESRPLPTAERVGVDVSNQMALTLEDAIRLALQNNNDIDSAKLNVEISEFNLTAARGVYDPIFSNESYYESRTTPTSSVIGGAGATGSVTQTDFTSGTRFGGFTPFQGGSYQADFSSTRLTSNNQNVTLNPQFPAALTLTYTQPLFRGRRTDLNRRNIEIAKKNLSLSDEQFRQRAIETISQVEQSYWDMVFALRNLSVQIDAVKQARAQYESNQRLVQKGALAPIEIVAASTQITTFEQNVYTAQEQVTRAENVLKTLILKERTDEMWNRPITPVTPVSLEAPRADLTEAVNAALKNRPEVSQLKTNAEINQINERFLRDQTKPQIDLIGSFTSAGLAGNQVIRTTPTGNAGTTAQLIERVNALSAINNLPPLNIATTNNAPPSNLVGGYFNSLGNLAQFDFPTYRVGVRVEIPFRNRTREANLGVALVEGTRIKNQQAQTAQIIEADVRNSLQTLRSAEARLQSAAAARASSNQQLESEQRQFRAGTTTVFLVLQRQTELLAARGRELQAQTDLNKAISEFYRAVGTTLEANNVSINKNGTDSPIFTVRRPFTIKPVLTDD